MISPIVCVPQVRRGYEVASEQMQILLAFLWAVKDGPLGESFFSKVRLYRRCSRQLALYLMLNRLLSTLLLSPSTPKKVHSAYKLFFFWTNSKIVGKVQPGLTVLFCIL